MLNASRIREAKEIICSNLETIADLGGTFLIVHSSIFADPETIIIDEKGNPCPGQSVFRDVNDKNSGMLERVKEGMAFYAAKAKKLGVVVALETDWENNFMLPEFISEADKDACGICFDTGHAQFESDVVEVIKQIGPHVVCTHIHDNDGTYDQHNIPFTGIINWEGFLFELMKAGYSGGFTFECMNGTMDDLVEARAKITDILSRIDL